MKYCKRFTEGLAYLACFLILIFIAYTYFTFGEPVLDEESGELTTVMSVRGMKQYLILFAALFIPAVICSATDRLPFIGIIASAVPVFYSLKFYADKMLVFCPMMIIILIVLFFAGEIVATVQWFRTRKPEGAPH